MIVAACELDLYFLEQPQSLKRKRQILKSLKDRIRNRFCVAIAEVEKENLWQRSVIAIASIAKEKRQAQSIITKVIEFIEKDTNLEIINYNLEFF